MKLRSALSATFLTALSALPSFGKDSSDVIDTCGRYPICNFYKTDLGTTIRARHGDPEHASRILINIFEKNQALSKNGKFPNPEPVRDIESYLIDQSRG